MRSPSSWAPDITAASPVSRSGPSSVARFATPRARLSLFRSRVGVNCCAYAPVPSGCSVEYGALSEATAPCPPASAALGSG